MKLPVNYRLLDLAGASLISAGLVEEFARLQRLAATLQWTITAST